MKYGESYNFIGRPYPKSLFKSLQIGDYVTIHPIKGVSQATKSYPAKIVETEAYNNRMELALKGVNENSEWHGAILNEYGFSRLEFKGRAEKQFQPNK